MIKMMLSGCNGKMGQVITGLVRSNHPDIEIVAGYDIQNTSLNGYPVYNDTGNIVQDIDVIIDFSHPNCFESITAFAVRKKIPLVIATTGLHSKQTEHLSEIGRKIPVFFSANMSLGVNILIDCVVKCAKLLYNNFDIEIIEKHHNQKVDAPSGTALAIADAVSAAIPPHEYIYDRHSVRKKRGKREIGIHAVRGGTIVGEHSVIFAGNDEILEIKHSALSKEIFAVGAIEAAKFLLRKDCGVYSMDDIVKF